MEMAVLERAVAEELLAGLRDRTAAAGGHWRRSRMPQGPLVMMSCLTTASTRVLVGVMPFEQSSEHPLLSSSIMLYDAGVPSWMRWVYSRRPKSTATLFDVACVIKDVLRTDGRLLNQKWLVEGRGGRLPLPQDFWSGSTARF